jgi:hypothetical protein
VTVDKLASLVGREIASQVESEIVAEIHKPSC